MVDPGDTHFQYAGGKDYFVAEYAVETNDRLFKTQAKQRPQCDYLCELHNADTWYGHH